MSKATKRMAELAAIGAYNVTMDVPLLIRLLEFAREEARDDVAVHRLVERCARAGANNLLDMTDYLGLVEGVAVKTDVPPPDPSAIPAEAPAPEAPANAPMPEAGPVAELAPVPTTAAAKTRKFTVRATLDGRVAEVDSVEAADDKSALEKARAKYGAKVTVVAA